MSKEAIAIAITQAESMTIEDMLLKGLYVLVEEVKGSQLFVDIFSCPQQASEAFRNFRKFDTETAKTKLLSPKVQ